MNNLMLSFSGAQLSQLRSLVNAVDKEIAKATAEGEGPKTALDMTWSQLVALLELGPEPEMRECPSCKHSCMLGATRCWHCWSALPALKMKETLAA
jgi:hypothetical protein